MRARPLLERLLENASAEPNTGCWLWMGKLDRKGYGRLGVRVPGRKHTVPKLAHNLLYRLLVGEIPEGKELDHLCRVRCCVNPQHLEPVTHQTNVRRGSGPGWNGINVAAALKRAQTHCKNGHPWTPENTKINMRNGKPVRYCRECFRAVDARRRQTDERREYMRNLNKQRRLSSKLT